MVSSRLEVVAPGTDHALVIALALLSCLCAALLPPSLAVLRAPLALPLVLALPGYALVSLAFRPGDLRATEVVMLSVSISIVATIATGLALDVLSVKLTAAPWMGLLAVITVAAAVRASVRGHARPLNLPRLRLRPLEAGAGVAVLALLGAAAALGFTPLAAPKNTPGTSALWIVPAPGGRAAACVGLINEELRTTTYTIEVSVAGVPAEHFGPITLAAGGSWTRIVPVGAGHPAVTASLDRVGVASAAPYRSVALRHWNIVASHC